MIFIALMFNGFSAHAQLDGRHHLLRIAREVVFHNPVVIRWLHTEHIFHSLALMLSEHEDLLAFLIKDDLSRKVSILMMCRKLGKLLHVVGWALRLVSFTILEIDALIFVKHGAEHIVCGLGIGHGTMRTFQLGMTEIAVGALQRSRFHFHVDVHHIDETAVFKVEVIIHTEKLLHQHRQVEFQDVITRQIGVADEQGDFLGLFAKGGFVGHHLIGIAMH